MPYLRQEEKQRSRELWKEAFPEDSESFVDYYYAQKLLDNQIMVREEEDQVVSMIHLNPYRLMVNRQIWPCDYIVGVATSKDHRRKGHMRALFIEMMEDLYQEGRQFCFLMPADPAIYRPFDFTFIFDQPRWRLKRQKHLDVLPYNLEQGLENHPPQEIADWMNAFLYNRYQVYSFRDEAYVKSLCKELLSEQGEMNLLYDDTRLVGVQCLWGLKEQEQRMLLCEENYIEEEKKSLPSIMARIIHLQNFVKVIGLKSDCGKEKLSVRLTVTDQFCRENEGIYLWHLRRDGSVLEVISQDLDTAAEIEEHTALSISELTSWLFGYSTPDSGSWMEMVQTLHGIFLDEVV